MALSGSFSGSIVSGHYKLRVDWSATQSVANNTSKITAVMYLVNDWRLAISTRSDNSTSIAGTASTWSSPAINGTGTTKLATVTSGNITHNADGTKSVTLSATFYVRATISGTYYEKITASATVTLNTIPRATTPTLSASSADMGASVTINTPRASSSFTHDLAYSFAGGSYVSIATGVATSKTWTVPDLASKIPNATSGTVTIRCITKNGSTTIGTKTVLLTAKVPSSVIPTVSSVSVVEAMDGLAEKFGAFVQGKSKAKVTVTGAGAKGSTIKAYQATLLGATYTAASWTSGVLTKSGDLKVRVKDSRGRWSSYHTAPVSVLPYTTPTAGGLSAYRCDADGNAADDGEYIAVSYKYSVASLNNLNTANMTLEYKPDAESEYAPLLTGSDLSADTTVKPDSPTFSADMMYDLRLTVTDYFGASASAVAFLPSAAVILDLKADGKGISFGMVSTIPGMDVGFTTRHMGGLLQPILEPDTDLNDVRTPNTYTGENVSTYNYANCPVTVGTFTLKVEAGGSAGQTRQILTLCSKNTPRTYERFYYSGTWSNWVCTSNVAGTVLWEGAYYMHDTQTITLAAPVSQQNAGIVLVYSRYNSGARDDGFTTDFVPKWMVANLSGKDHMTVMCTNDLSLFCVKRVFIKDTTITGHAYNDQTGTGASGITYKNNSFVLRYVIGV